MLKISIFALGFFIALTKLSSCSHYTLERQRYSLPERSSHQLLDELPNEKKVLLSSFNNLNGQVEGVESLGIQIGGLELLTRYLEALGSLFPERWISLGTGDLMPLQPAGPRFIEQLSALPVNLLGVSAQDFPTWLGVDTQIPLVNSNIFDIQESKLYDRPPFVGHYLIEKNQVKLGFISVAAPPPKTLVGYYFEDMTAAILRARSYLQKAGAEVMVLLLHEDTGCTRVEEQLNCSSEGTLERILRRLPQDSLQVVFATSEYHSYGRWRDLFVVTSPGNGLYLSTLVLAYDKAKKKVNLERSHLPAPTLLCSAFFQLSEDCFIGDSRRLSELHEDKLRTIPARFFGQEIPIDR